MAEWQPIETAPKDGTNIIAWYDHAADPYRSPTEPNKLTVYAAWADGGDYMAGTGKLFWLERPVEMFSDNGNGKEKNASRWNTRHARNEAFTHFNKDGYLHGSVLHHTMSAHRIIWAMVHDEWPETIDHINGNPSDNRIANLRSVSIRENRKNSARSILNTSGVSGVHWASRGKWVASIGLPQFRKTIGYFDSFEAAVAARKAAESENGYHANHGRDSI